MRKQIKLSESIAKNIDYVSGGDNSVLRQILYAEQKGFCAYTETFLGRTDQKDIDHFNPLVNYIERNNYQNLFLCKSQWNKEKSNKWEKFQPVLSPLNTDFENRIQYNIDLKLFEAADETDMEAKNLVTLLKLDDYDLSLERRKYIALCLEMMQTYDNPIKYFETVIRLSKHTLQFISSLEIEFNIKIWETIPEITHNQ